MTDKDMSGDDFVERRPGEKQYIGDGVYAEIRSGQIALTVDYGEGAVETIILEPEVYERLQGFVAHTIKQFEAARKRVAP